MSHSRLLSLAVAAMAGSLLLPATPMPSLAQPAQVAFKPSRRQLERANGIRLSWNYHGIPITVAHAKRMAIKTKNRRRNKLAHRGKR